MPRLYYEVQKYELSFNLPSALGHIYGIGSIYGVLTLKNPSGSGNVCFVGVDPADEAKARPSPSRGHIFYPVRLQLWEQLVDTVRNESPVWVSGLTEGTEWLLKTGDEPVGEEET